MSALSASGIDNIIIDVNGSEIPIMDGSSIAFIHLIKSAIIKEQKKPKKFVVINQLIEVADGDKLAKFEPYKGFIIDFMIDFPHPAFNDGDSHVSIDFFKDSYINDISRARTFGFMQEVEYLRTNGLARGGSLDNAIVLDEYRILNEDGLRYSDEFVRHKILDAVGDLYMLGSPIIGKFTAYKSGHELNNKLLRALVENPQSWSLENLDINDIEMTELAKDYLSMANEFNNDKAEKTAMIFILILILLLITLVTLTMFYVVTKNKKYIFIIRSIMNYSIYFGVFFGVMYLLLRVAHI